MGDDGGNLFCFEAGFFVGVVVGVVVTILIELAIAHVRFV
jgi:hypothetical protein